MYEIFTDGKTTSPSNNPDRLRPLYSVSNISANYSAPTEINVQDRDELKLSEHKDASCNLLYGFAQVAGQFYANGSLIKSDAFEILKHKVMYRPAGGIWDSGGVPAGGGGTLGATTVTPSSGWF